MTFRRGGGYVRRLGTTRTAMGDGTLQGGTRLATPYARMPSLQQSPLGTRGAGGGSGGQVPGVIVHRVTTSRDRSVVVDEDTKAGDALINFGFYFRTSGDDLAQTPAGWDLLSSSTGSGGIGVFRMLVWGKIAEAGDAGSSVTFWDAGTLITRRNVCATLQTDDVPEMFGYSRAAFSLFEDPITIPGPVESGGVMLVFGCHSKVQTPAFPELTMPADAVAHSSYEFREGGTVEAERSRLWRQTGDRGSVQLSYGGPAGQENITRTGLGVAVVR